MRVDRNKSYLDGGSTLPLAAALRETGLVPGCHLLQESVVKGETKSTVRQNALCKPSMSPQAANRLLAIRLWALTSAEEGSPLK